MNLFNKIYQFKNNIALFNTNFGSVSYSDLIQFSSFMASKISDHSLILFVSKNNIEAIMGYVGMMIGNNVVMFADIKTKEKDLNELIVKYQPDYIFCPKENLFQNNFENKLSLKNYILYKTNTNIKKELNKNLSILLPTSGSMGSCKYVRLSKNNIFSNSQSIISYLNIRPDDKTVTNMPLSYSYMLSIINTHLLSGASILVTDKSLLDKNFWNDLKNFKVTSFNGVPFIYEIMLKLGLENIWVPSFCYLTQAGGKLDLNKTKEIINFCKLKNASFIPMYGQTEASPRISYLNWKYIDKKSESIGKPIPGSKMWIGTRGSVKPGKIGDLYVSGDNVCLGYANSYLDLKNGDENNGILKTGDLAFKDEDGFFFIKGRTKRIAKIYGNRINLDEIEERMGLIGIKIGCVEAKDKIIVFYDDILLKNVIEDKLFKETGQNKKGFVIHYLKKLPLTNSLKINYSKLEKIKND